MGDGDVVVFTTVGKVVANVRDYRTVTGVLVVPLPEGLFMPALPQPRDCCN